MNICFNDFDNLKWYGRYLDYENARFFDFSASGFEFCFTGKKATALILSDSPNHGDANKGVIGVYVSELSSAEEYKGESLWENFPEDLTNRFILTEKENNLVLFESEKEKTVLIRVLKLSEVNFGSAGLKELVVDGTLITKKTESKAKKIEVIGDSITCGYGIEGVWEKDTFTTKQQRADKAYAFLTAKKLGADFQLCSWSGIGIISKYVDPSVELPDTTVVMPSVWPYIDKSLSLRLGIEPEVWDEKRFSPDIVIVHLGTNDASFVRKVEERRLAYVSGLRQFLEAIHRRSPKAKICCCLGVMGQDLCDSVSEAVELFNKDFSKVATKVVKFPVQLEEDGIAADWHPSAKTHEKVALQLSEALKEWM
ncbi:MAG: GDSL-type esterase/lipase family protein [Treponema sp.]|nr:GDSL-type esterase/lipase family protein [Treponema sp.]